MTISDPVKTVDCDCAACTAAEELREHYHGVLAARAAGQDSERSEIRQPCRKSNASPAAATHTAVDVQKDRIIIVTQTVDAIDPVSERSESAEPALTDARRTRAMVRPRSQMTFL